MHSIVRKGNLSHMRTMKSRQACAVSRFPLRIKCTVVEWFEPDHEVPGSNHTGDGIQFMALKHFIAQSLSLSPFHCLGMTKMMLKWT